MSQVITPAQPPGPSPPPNVVLPQSSPAQQGRAQMNWMIEGFRAAFAGTPGRLRLIALGVIAGCLIAGFGSAWALQQRSSALGAAKDTTQHLVQLQRVETNLLQADALITNTFLQGGLENTGQLTRYYASIDAATADLANAARASDADAAALASANTYLARYTGLVEDARANNRQDLPVGASYLKSATASLTADVIAPVEQRAKADTRAIDNALDRAQNARWLLLVIALIGLAVLVYAQLVLARTTRRFINLPAAGATVALAAALLLAAGVMAAVQNTAGQARTGAYADTTQLSNARVAAFQAKAKESLDLVNRGSGDPKDEAWKALFGTARDLPRVAQAATSSLDTYRVAHELLRTKDDAGDWDGAVATAVSTAKGSGNAAFDAYSTTTESVLKGRAEAASNGFDAGPVLSIIAILLALAGIAAAIVGWFGVSLRMGEYR